MNDIPNWAVALASLAGSISGSFMAVKISIARLQERMTAAEGDIKDLQDWRTEHEGVTRKGLSDISRLEGRSEK